MSEAPSLAAFALRSWGAVVEPLPTSSEEESDWLATLEGCRLIIEEKTKIEDDDRLAARAEALGAGRVHTSTVPLTFDNRLSGIVRKASKQISSSAARREHELRVLWFTGTGYDGEAKHYQLVSTLYGSTRIFERVGARFRTCYFFRNGDFYRYRDILDGAYACHLAGETLTIDLCLNPYSPRWEELRDSPFVKRLSGGPIDPVAQEESGEALIMDGDVQRSDEAGVLAYLQNKYSLQEIMNMDMGMTSAAIRVPKNEG
jgi:hypothetical protein